MKSAPHYELIFALDAPTTLALSEAASQVLSQNLGSNSVAICDRYYQQLMTGTKARTRKPPRSQYRIRELENEVNLYLQKLTWKGDVCTVRESAVSRSDFEQARAFHTPESQNAAIRNARKQPGHWFHKKVAKHTLKPAVQIQAERLTWRSDSSEGDAELILERNICATRLSDKSCSSPALAVSSNLARMTFATALPAAFKRLVYDFSLLPERSTILLELAEQQLAEQQPSKQTVQVRSGQRSNLRKTTSFLTGVEVHPCQIG